MDTVTILFGTESGNSEMVADDISKYLEDNGVKSEVFDMEDYDVGDLGMHGMLLIISSTYGEGDLPQTAQPFFDALAVAKPDLSSIRFAAFGLGDSTYDTYNLGITTLTSMLADLGATQVGDTGRHDADGGLDASDVAVAWATDLFAAARV